MRVVNEDLWNNLGLILEELISYMDQVVILMFTKQIITIFVAIWAVRKVSKLLNIIH